MSSSDVRFPRLAAATRLEVAGHAAVDDVAEVALEDAHGFFLGVPAAAGVDTTKIRRARGSHRSWVTAMRCRQALTRRLPPRSSGMRRGSHEPAEHVDAGPYRVPGRLAKPGLQSHAAEGEAPEPRLSADCQQTRRHPRTLGGPSHTEELVKHGMHAIHHPLKVATRVRIPLRVPIGLRPPGRRPSTCSGPSPGTTPRGAGRAPLRRERGCRAGCVLRRPPPGGR
jgi:hypothetical protein